MKIPCLIGAVLGVAIHTQALAASDAPLTLDAAVRLALEADDPSVRQFEEQAASLAEKAVAESQLPDPQLGVTMVNLPTSFSFTQENMTQFQTSLSQSFPAGRTLALRGAKRRAESAGAREAARLRELEIVRETRRAWLEMFYWAAAEAQIRKSRDAVADLEVATRADYSAGRGSSQALMRTRFELSLLDDRLIEAGRQFEIARANLARFIGEEAARRALPQDMPVLKFPEAPDALRELLLRHPAVRMTDSTIEARKREVEIAAQQYKPDWAVRAGYGVRGRTPTGRNRDDFITVGVSLDVPLFTAKRQDKAVAAAKRSRQSAQLSREATLLELNRQLERSYAAWKRLSDRIRLYEEAVIERAEGTTEASVISYQSGVTDFPELIRAELAELDTQLQLIRLRVDRAKTQADLLYLEGEN